jgi:hypothetical protein
MDVATADTVPTTTVVHTEIANLYNASVYLSMQGIASTVTPLSNGTAPIRGPALAKEVASVRNLVVYSVALTKKELRSKKKRSVPFDSNMMRSDEGLGLRVVTQAADKRSNRFAGSITTLTANVRT